MNKIKKSKGITLIALIITVIVLLILAAVTINMLFGQDGIISNAQKAVSAYEKAQLKERLDSIRIAAEIEALDNGHKLEIADYLNALKEAGVIDDATVGGENVEYDSSSGMYIITTNDGYVVTVTEDEKGNLVEEISDTKASDLPEISISKLELTSTVRSITATVTASNADGAKYIYTVTGEGYSKTYTATTNTYIIGGLTNNKTYTVNVEVKKGYRKASKSDSIKTEEITDASEQDVVQTSEFSWDETRNTASITISVSNETAENYNIQYKVNDIENTQTEYQTIANGTTLTGLQGEILLIIRLAEITENEPPTVSISPTGAQDVVVNQTKTYTITASDSKSGIKKTYYKFDNSSSDITDVSGYTLSFTGNSKNDIVFDDTATVGAERWLHTLTVDKCGNTAYVTSGKITVKPDTVTITYNANGGEGSIASASIQPGSSTTLSDGTGFTKTNYPLVGWATSESRANAGTVDYAKGASFTTDANTTLWAVWAQLQTLKNAITVADYGKPIAYTVSFDGKQPLTDWKVFYNDGSNVYIIYGDYLPSTYLPKGATSRNVVANTSGGSCSVYIRGKASADSSKNCNTIFTEVINDTSTWNAFAQGTGSTSTVVGYSATGSPTYNMLRDSANAYLAANPGGIDKQLPATVSIGTYFSTDTTSTRDTAATKRGLYKPYSASQDSCYGYWLALPISGNALWVWRVIVYGGVNYDGCHSTDSHYAFRPVVCLKSDITGKIGNTVTNLQ